MVESGGDRLELAGLCVETPTEPARRLLRDLSLAVEAGRRVLVVGQRSSPGQVLVKSNTLVLVVGQRRPPWTGA